MRVFIELDGVLYEHVEMNEASCYTCDLDNSYYCQKNCKSQGEKAHCHRCSLDGHQKMWKEVKI